MIGPIQYVRVSTFNRRLVVIGVHLHKIEYTPLLNLTEFISLDEDGRIGAY